jgi:hypothetical protein
MHAREALGEGGIYGFVGRLRVQRQRHAIVGGDRGWKGAHPLALYPVFLEHGFDQLQGVDARQKAGAQIVSKANSIA